MGGDKPESSSAVRLTPLQWDLLTEFFSREQRLFLTGGAALAGFDFGHRTTDDLDLFATPPLDLDEPERTLDDVAKALGATLTPVSRHRDFRRWRVKRGEETCVVDLVVDRAPAVDVVKRQRGRIRLDTLREMAANKVCALISRAEVRDLVDLRALLDAGQSLEQALEDAGRKEAGADPATLAWVLSQMRIGPEARLPEGVSPAVLEAFRGELVRRLQALARGAVSD